MKVTVAINYLVELIKKNNNNDNKLTQSKQLSAQEGCRAQWVAIDRRSVGAWSAWCRVVSALHLAGSSMEKVCAVWSAHHHRGGEGGHMRTQFNPVRRTSSGGCVLRWKGGGTVGRLRPRRILLILFKEAIFPGGQSFMYIWYFIKLTWTPKSVRKINLKIFPIYFTKIVLVNNLLLHWEKFLNQMI